MILLLNILKTRLSITSVLAFLLVLGMCLPVHSQKMEYLNKFWYPIQDSSSHKIHFYRITLEDSIKKSVRIISVDSVLSYQRIEINEQKRQPFSKTEVWYHNSGKKVDVQVIYFKETTGGDHQVL